MAQRSTMAFGIRVRVSPIRNRGTRTTYQAIACIRGAGGRSKRCMESLGAHARPTQAARNAVLRLTNTMGK